MQGEIGVGVSAGRRNLRENRLLDQQVPAHAHDRLGQGGNEVGPELLVGNQIQGGPQRRQIVVRSSSGTGGAPRSVPFGKS